MEKRLVLLVIPDLEAKGGVSNYYRSLKNHFENYSQFEFRILQVGNKSKKFPSGLFALWKLCKDLLAFQRILKTEKIDLIHLNPTFDLRSFIRDGFFISLSKKKGIKILAFFRGDWLEKFEQQVSVFSKNLFRKTFLSADAYIILSKNFREKLLQNGITSPIFVETTTVDRELINSFSIEEKISDISSASKIKILFLARIEKEKGILETLEAFKTLLAEGLHIELQIAGEGSMLNQVINLVKSDNVLSPNVQFLGFVSGDKKRQTFEKNHIYCFPSYNEGMPNSLLEALSFGLPVITTLVGGIGDFFEDGKMGYVIPMKDSASIAENLRRLITDRALIAQMSLNNYQFAGDRYRSDKVANRLISIYQSLLQ